MTMCSIARAANRCGFHFKLFAKHVQYIDRLLNDFRTDAITWQNCYFHFFLDLNDSKISHVGQASAY
ncbi:hypothetical protein LT85_2752 [Collimonas arenae]|uniref:Uncharacterized protein n=1 Tax=Collimonas arenae TaxID=279058 RepID=A0A0A1FDN9_9BURK|nr:hypothetical protein LT85_2752 [Collimonas arenae]